MTSHVQIKAKIIRFFKHWFCFAVYVFGCAQVLMLLESEAQIQRQSERLVKRNHTRNKLINAVTSRHTLSHKGRKDLVIFIEDLIASHFDGNGDATPFLHASSSVDQSWDLVNSLYYCSSLYTTVGYGDMTCRTPGGRIFSIFFIVSSVPMWLNILAQLGYFLHLLLFNLWSAFRRFAATQHCFRSSGDALPVTPPLIFFTFLMLLCVTIMSSIMSYIDSITFLDSFYFTFVTFSTVGLGDVVPKTHFGKLRCFLISFNLGFAMLSGWISIAADIIYARQFTQRNPRSSHHTTGVRGPSFFLRSHTQRAKHLRKKKQSEEQHHDSAVVGGNRKLSASARKKPQEAPHHQIMRSSVTRASSRRRSLPGVPLRLRLAGVLVPRNDDFYHHIRRRRNVIKAPPLTLIRTSSGKNIMEMKQASINHSTTTNSEADTSF